MRKIHLRWVKGWDGEAFPILVPYKDPLNLHVTMFSFTS
jgi:hypothetical protein